MSSRFACPRVVAAHGTERDHQPKRRERPIIEWPAHEEAPIDYWLSSLPEGTEPQRLARLARLCWAIELDYRLRLHASRRCDDDSQQSTTGQM